MSIRGTYIRRREGHRCTFPGTLDPAPRLGDIWRCACGLAYERRILRWIRAAEYDTGLPR